MELRRPLRDHDDPQANAAPQADKVISGVQHSAQLRVRNAALGHEDMAFIDNQMQRSFIPTQ
jgi:hypothetical protein